MQFQNLDDQREEESYSSGYTPNQSIPQFGEKATDYTRFKPRYIGVVLVVIGVALGVFSSYLFLYPTFLFLFNHLPLVVGVGILAALYVTGIFSLFKEKKQRVSIIGLTALVVGLAIFIANITALGPLGLFIIFALLSGDDDQDKKKSSKRKKK